MWYQYQTWYQYQSQLELNKILNLIFCEWRNCMSKSFILKTQDRHYHHYCHHLLLLHSHRHHRHVNVGPIQIMEVILVTIRCGIMYDWATISSIYNSITFPTFPMDYSIFHLIVESDTKINPLKTRTLIFHIVDFN